MFRNIVQVFINVEALLGSLLARGSIQRQWRTYANWCPGQTSRLPPPVLSQFVTVESTYLLPTPIPRPHLFFCCLLSAVAVLHL